VGKVETVTYIKKDIADVRIREEEGDNYFLDLWRSRGAPEYEGAVEKLDRIACGVQEARAVAYLWTALRDAVLELRKENAELRARLEGKKPAKRKAA